MATRHPPRVLARVGANNVNERTRGQRIYATIPLAPSDKFPSRPAPCARGNRAWNGIEIRYFFYLFDRARGSLRYLFRKKKNIK